MGWLISLALLIVGSVNYNPMCFIAAGLFAIAGTIGWNTRSFGTGKIVEKKVNPEK